MRGNRRIPAIIKEDKKTAQLVKIDATGNGHLKQKTLPLRYFTVIDAHKWGGRWAGPKGQTYSLDTEWVCQGIPGLRSISISALTRAMAKKKFKVPASEAAWEERGLKVDWSKTWKQRPMYVAPRDTIVWLKVQHRTLWVAKNGGMNSKQCIAEGCREDESQLHLITCDKIKESFWKKITDIMSSLGLLPRNLIDQNFMDSIQKWGALLIAGQLDDKPVRRETSAFICWAWRALYSEIIHQRKEGRGKIDTEEAVWWTLRLAYSRVKAYGHKWRRWYLRQRLWDEDKRKLLAEKYRKFSLINFDREANYIIDSRLTQARNASRK